MCQESEITEAEGKVRIVKSALHRLSLPAAVMAAPVAAPVASAPIAEAPVVVPAGHAVKIILWWAFYLSYVKPGAKAFVVRTRRCVVRREGETISASLKR
jgi:acetyl-CoA carboxylase biotin carboxyl carrier protein